MKLELRQLHPSRIFELGVCVMRQDTAYANLIWFQIRVDTDEIWDELHANYDDYE